MHKNNGKVLLKMTENKEKGKEKRYQIERVLLNDAKKRSLSSGEYYTLLIVRIGNCVYREQEKEEIKQCGPNDIIIMKPNHKIWLQWKSSKHPVELFCIRYSTVLLDELSDADVDLQKSIEVVPFTCASVTADGGTAAILKNLFTRLEQISQEEEEFAQSMFEKNMLSMMLIIALRACIREEFERRQKGYRHFALDDLFAYIHHHITEEITLEELEKVFYVSRYHICREFKKQTGQTVHSYITKNRLRMCKKYILEGLPITEVYKMVGFGGYNHFFRAFKQEFGMTPKEYYKSHMENKQDFT